MEKTMKLSSETLTVLQNFAKLNSGIQFKAGNKIKTISTGKNVLAEATLKDSFPQDFCVYDLNKFLTIHSIGKDTDIDFDDIIKITNVLQSPNLVVESDGGDINLTSCDVKDSSADTNTIQVAAGNGQKFKMVFLTENLKMIPGSYDVEISSKGLSLFKNKNQAIQYFVATEAKYSKFGE